MSMSVSFKLFGYVIIGDWCCHVLVWFTNHLFGEVIGTAHNWFKRGKNKCSISQGFQAHQETEVTPGWISVCICLFEL